MNGRGLGCVGQRPVCPGYHVLLKVLILSLSIENEDPLTVNVTNMFRAPLVAHITGRGRVARGRLASHNGQERRP